MQTSSSELDEAKNKIKELEQKIAILEAKVKDEQNAVKEIEENMKSFYVENWTVTDSCGKKGTFSGNIYWIKGSGSLYYKNGTYFEGDWDSIGEINYGELRRTYTDDVITKWEGGEEVYEHEDKDE
jgi:uncharacterized FAD-dependent dehydrogenase